MLNMWKSLWVGATRGILVMWNSLCCLKLDELIGEFLVSVLLLNLRLNKEWAITSVYGPTDSSQRGLLWTDLNRVAQKWVKPYMVRGDFNVTYFADESNKEGPATSAVRDFADWIQFHNLIDMPPSGYSFIWSNNQEQPILSRLDRFFISPSWLELFPKMPQRILSRSTTMHQFF